MAKSIWFAAVAACLTIGAPGAASAQAQEAPKGCAWVQGARLGLTCKDRKGQPTEEIVRPGFDGGTMARARADDPEAMRLLGGFLLYTDSTAKDAKAGHALIKRSAEAGNAEAMFELGLTYEGGEGGKVDFAEAIRWHKKAAEKGVANAMSNLGGLYLSGRGVPRDPVEAVRWYRAAAEAGSLPGMNNLGTAYRDGVGVAKDQAQAVRWFKAAADKGLPDGAFNLGVQYANGAGVEQDMAMAVRCWDAAAKTGDVDAMMYLAQAYDQGGPGLAKEPAKALVWLRVVARMAGPEQSRAMILIGIHYDGGMGVTADPKEARKWFQAAADLGDKRAKDLLKTSN